MQKKYDTLVCETVKRNPLEFVDILIDEAKDASDLAPLLREAACVIANLLLTDDDWHTALDGNAKTAFIVSEVGRNTLGPSQFLLKHIVPEKGKTYHNHACGDFICEEVLHDENPCVCVLRRTSDGYTLRAHEILEYPDGTIQWAYSGGGHWPDGYSRKKNCSPG